MTQKAVERVDGRISTPGGAGRVPGVTPRFVDRTVSGVSRTRGKSAGSAYQADPLMAEARRNGVRMEAERAGRQAVLTSQLGREQKARQAVLKRQNLDEIAGLKTLEKQKNVIAKAQTAKTERRKESFSNARQSVATGALAGLGVLAAGAGVALAAAKENINANRALSATATEAGKSYGDLAIAAQNYGKAANVSATDAAKQTAGLQRLLTTAGKADELERYQKGFTDVAAARGIDPAELSNLFQQIASGEDEALNRLGKSDPGVLKEIYAKKHGLKADDLTQAQAVQSRLDAFEPDFDLFAGANADKMGSFSGQADLASKSIADITTNVGLAITQNAAFQESLTTINYILGELAGMKPIDIQIRLKQGESVEKLAEEQADSLGNQITRGITSYSGIGQVARAGFYVYDALTQGFDTAGKNFDATSGNARRQQDIDKYKGQIQKEKEGIDKQETAAVQQKALAETKRNAEAQKTAQEAAQKALSTSYKRQVKYDLKDARQNVGKLQSVLGSVQKSGLLKEDEKADLVADIEERIENARERLIQAKREVRSIVANTASAITGSPVAAMFDDAQVSIQGVYDKYKDLDTKLAQTAANATRLAEALKLGKAAFESGMTGVDFRQQAQMEKYRMPDEMNGYSRKLGLTGQLAGLIGDSANYKTEARLSRQGAYQNANASKEALRQQEEQNNFDSFYEYGNTAKRLDEMAASIPGTGIEGRAAIAQAKLNQLMSPDQLDRIIATGDPQNVAFARGQYLERAQQNEILQQNSEAQIKKALAKDAVIQATTLPFAQQKLEQLQANSGLLNNKEYLDQFLAITGELGDEITPEMSKMRVSVLEARAKIEEKNRVELLKAITDLGVIFTKTENVVFINNAKDSATVNRKPKAADVARRYGK